MRLDAKVFDSLLEPTFVIDPESKVLYANEPAALICETPLRRILRQKPSFTELFQFEQPIEALKNLATVTDPSPYQEVVFHTSQQTRGKVQLTIQKFQEGEYLVFFRDVTLEERLQRKYKAELEQKEGYIEELKKAQEELKKYSEGLEKMVADRTAELSELNRLMKALLDSLGQGFFVFNNQGNLFPISSKACESVIEQNPQGKAIWDVLKISEKQKPGFEKWMKTLFMEMLPFEDLKPLGPQNFPHSQGRTVSLNYHPLRGEKNLEGVVVVATDISDLVAAQKQADHERATAKMIVSLVQSQRHAQSFVREASHILHELKEQMQAAEPKKEEIFRGLHTLKGGAATFSVQEVADLCHHAEGLVNNLPARPNKTEPDWMPLAQEVEKIAQEFQKFLLENEAILGASDKWTERWMQVPASKVRNFDLKWLRPYQDRVFLRQDFLENFWLEPVGPLFEHFNLVVQQVATQLGKQVAPLELEGGEIPVDPEAYERLLGSLIHAFRNAVDHGIEPPDVREAAGKNAQGKIQIRFQTQHVHGSPVLRICIKDDGGGINPEKIREKLEKKGLRILDPDPRRLIQKVFDSQFSTKDEASTTSGRGVGLDAVMTEAKALGGFAWVESELGRGTQLWIEVPLLQNPGSGAQPKAA